MAPGAAQWSLVAHRGFPTAFPENTLLGFQQAAACGARYIETDVQCLRDGTPVLYHDAGTRRLSGVAGRVHERTLDELDALDAYFPKRFGDRFAGTPVPTLGAFAGWLAQHPAVTAFVEIKTESLAVFGVEPLMRRVMAALAGASARCVVISFDDQCLEHAAADYGIRTGWVLPEWSPRVESRARALAPDFLFADQQLFPAQAGAVWRGPWLWGVYVVDDPARALAYVERGVHLVETDAIGGMLYQCSAAKPEGP